MKCWGHNGYGELGWGAGSSPVPVDVYGITSAIEIAGGGYHFCAVLSNGTAQCWGSNWAGQIGNGNKNGQSYPVAVVGLSGLHGPYNPVAKPDIAVGGYSDRGHTCAVSGGLVKCWGLGASGQLGNGSSSSSLSPVTVSGITTAIAVTTGREHSCALLADRTARCWGNNTSGQLGNGNNTSSNSPTTVTGSNIMGISAGENHTCYLDTSGNVYCFGYGGDGQMGCCGYSNRNQGVYAGKDFIQISAGGAHVCGRKQDGRLFCWGDNSFGQFGNGNTTGSNTPVTNAPGPYGDLISLSAGQRHNCGLFADNSTKCWGWNYFGQLGYQGNNATSPTLVSGLTDVAALASGGATTCAMKYDGTTQCWGGESAGRLGRGWAYEGFYPPTNVVDLSNASSIANGNYHACARLRNGTMKCWGANTDGQLGDGTTNTANTAKSVSGL